MEEFHYSFKLFLNNFLDNLHGSWIHYIRGGDYTMAKFNQQPNKTSAGTNIQEVRQQNAQSSGGASAGSQGQFGTEFAKRNKCSRSKTTKPRSRSS